MNFLLQRPTAAYDTECYRNFWMIAFRDVAGDKRKHFEMYDGHPLDIDSIKKIIRAWRLVSFNGINYDVPLLTLALAGVDCNGLKEASDAIIVGGMKWWEVLREYELKPPAYMDHIDLIEPAPGQASLKIYGGRLHSKRMADLPIEPDAIITPQQRKVLIPYCYNDLDTTIDLFNELKQQIDLRSYMSQEYQLDLRSKSDAQMAEAVVKSRLEKMTGERVEKPAIKAGTFKYRIPDFIEFETASCQRALTVLMENTFVIRGDGQVIAPKALDELVIKIGGGNYRMGIGGLHSSEESISYFSDENFKLIDSDVTSYYPFIIINNDLAPRSLGRNFLTVFKQLVALRIEAKRAGNKAVAESLKIVINGLFGKLGSPYSILYSPDLMIQVTITGQLCLLMAIERLHLAEFEVISANTDGFVTLVPRDRELDFDCEMYLWEQQTKFTLEQTFYESLHSHNVNNYLAIKKGGEVKLKGTYAPSGPGQPAASGLKKNPTAEISTDAVVAYLSAGTPIETTIRECTDIKKFVAIRQVRGGAMKDDRYLGKAVRWYYAEDETGSITYKTNGNSVPRSVGAKPLMELPEGFPQDVDYGWYARESYGILKDIGMKYVDPSFVGRSGTAFARLPHQKTVHMLDLGAGSAVCGRASTGPRVKWVEYDDMPAGHRLCSKCSKSYFQEADL
jgi:hypothetical protein